MVEEKKRQPLLDFLNKIIDEGRTEEIDIEEVDRKLFGGVLNLTGRVKLHMEPFKKTENRQ